MPENKRYEFLRSDYTKGFPGHLGIEVTRIEPGQFESELKIRPDHGQREGFVHAGVLATMADHTAGYAAFTVVPEDVTLLTIELKINYFKPAVGDKVVCRSKVINQGKRVVVSESELFACKGEVEKMIGKATVTLMAVSPQS